MNHDICHWTKMLNYYPRVRGHHSSISEKEEHLPYVLGLRIYCYLKDFRNITRFTGDEHVEWTCLFIKNLQMLLPLQLLLALVTKRWSQNWQKQETREQAGEGKSFLSFIAPNRQEKWSGYISRRKRGWDLRFRGMGVRNWERWCDYAGRQRLEKMGSGIEELLFIP